jgi:predicted MPP superfamily phosphohydrolase
LRKIAEKKKIEDEKAAKKARMEANLKKKGKIFMGGGNRGKKATKNDKPELMPEEEYKELVRANKKKLDEAGLNHKSFTGLHGR